MSRITSVTKNIINNHYDEKIKELKNSYKIYEQQYKEYKIEEFNEDKNVIQAKELLEIINKSYNTDFDIKLYSYRIDGTKCNNCQIVLEKIKDINKERNELLVVLDNLPKNSREYKQALLKLKEIIN